MSDQNATPEMPQEEVMTVEPAGKFVPTAEMDNAGNVWLSLTDEQRSELLHQRRVNHTSTKPLPGGGKREA
ncbi:hypothetical protein [Lentzea sp. NPDC051838]|uniref:hypothetical protein n=1 Tax=Lentzea sp. NPDC051838 TaxID=3154849 RepID=UPI003442A73A